MSCPDCGAANPPTNRFCGSCGAALVVECASCGARNPPTNHFCGDCGGQLRPEMGASTGARPAPSTTEPSPRAYTPPHLAEKIVRSRAALEGEHKQITALFADVVDSTPLAERLGPEATHDLIRRCFNLMLDAVHRYEGTVSQFTGDGILALFGAPIAHEDHAQRAVHAALAMQLALGEYQRELAEQRGITFQVRVGLNSGPVVVGTIGTDLNMTYTAIGDTVNLASRIQGLAEPGTIVVSEATERLIRGYFVTRDLGQHQVKGKVQAVGVREVLRPSRSRTRLDVYAERGLTPLVGRDRELKILEDAFAEARAGRGAVAFIAGDPGIGKSRLIYELKRRLEGEQLLWREGRCIAYGGDIAYLPIVDLLKDSFGIREADGEAGIIQKTEDGSRTLGEEVLEGRPFLRFLLSADPGDPSVATMDPQMRKARIFEALRALALASSAVRPLVIVLEDLHWVDRLSEEVLSYLIEAVAGQRILILLTHRLGYGQPFGTRPYFTDLRLGSLSETDSATLAGKMLSADHFPDELQRIIAGKAEGNPFFVEEVVKSLLETNVLRATGDGYVLAKPIDQIDVPDTIQGVIMARLDRLDEEPKRALQTAAVIGREFAVRLLERTTELEGRADAYLRELKSVELIYERSLYPELAFMFKHALTHDVAYNSLLLARRKALHYSVGIAIEELYHDRLREHYETLAYHYERAEAWDKALEYLQKSGEKALTAFAPAQAVAYYDRALAVEESSGQRFAPERAIGLHYGRGQALTLTSDFDRSAESFKAMQLAAQQVGDAVQEGLALNQRSLAYIWGHHFEAALEQAERARQHALTIGNEEILAGSLLAHGYVCSLTGRMEEARAVLTEMLATTRLVESPVSWGFAHYLLGQVHRWQGDEASARIHVGRGLQLGRQYQSSMVILRGLWVEGLTRCGRGDYEEAVDSLKEHLDLSRRLGERATRCRVLNTLGWVYTDLCNWNLAVEYNRQSAVEGRTLGDPETYRNAELNLADCYLVLGRLDEAERLLEATERDSAQRGTWGEEWMKWRYTQHLHASLGELWLARGSPSNTIEYADRCLETALETTSRRYIVKGRRLKGEALLALGDLEAAETEIEQALTVARFVGNPAQLRMTLAALGRLRSAQARPDEAVDAYREAIAVAEDVASRLSDPVLRETLLSSTQVAALREALARCER